MMDITKEENNIEDHEMHQSNEWASRVMSGLWKGTGRWEDDEQWKGHGTWNGGLLSGNWNGIGKWESEDNKMGHWTGKGDLICNMSFQNYTPIALILLSLSFVTIGLIISIFIINFIFMMKFIKEIGIITILFLAIILIALRKTNKGKWEATGTWEDVGDFRISKIQGTWKLGYHKGNFFREMKDRKPHSHPSSMDS
jgi:hypothetical protein